MAYNPENAKETATIPADTIFDGAITEVKDGQIRNFVDEQALTKWESDPSTPAIEVTAEVKVGGEPYKFNTLFTYKQGKDGLTEYSAKSKLGKFRKKYGTLPAAGVAVKAMSNSEGFLRLKLD